MLNYRLNSWTKSQVPVLPCPMGSHGNTFATTCRLRCAHAYCIQKRLFGDGSSRGWNKYEPIIYRHLPSSYMIIWPFQGLPKTTTVSPLLGASVTARCVGRCASGSCRGRRELRKRTQEASEAEGDGRCWGLLWKGGWKWRVIFSYAVRLGLHGGRGGMNSIRTCTCCMPGESNEE